MEGYGRRAELQKFMSQAKQNFSIEVTIAGVREFIANFSGSLALGYFQKAVGGRVDAPSDQARSLSAAASRRTRKLFGRLRDRPETNDQGIGLKQLSIHVLKKDFIPYTSKYLKDSVIREIRDFLPLSQSSLSFWNRYFHRHPIHLCLVTVTRKGTVIQPKPLIFHFFLDESDQREFEIL
jgi:hypothetical protein